MGYLLVDNTASGGIKYEADTQHCRHCQAVIDMQQWKKDGGIWKCSKCFGPICSHCTGIAAANNYACSPWQKQIEEQIKLNHRIAREFGK